MRCLDHPLFKGLLLLGGLLLILTSCRPQPASTAVDTEGGPDASQEVPLPDEATLDEMDRLSNCGEVERPQKAPEGIVVDLELNRETYAPGQLVKMTLRLRHLGTEPVPGWWGHLTETDLWVQEGHEVIWRRGYRKAVFDASVEEEIPPGEQRNDGYLWNQEVCPPDGMGEEDYLKGPLPEGDYLARGIWHRSQQVFVSLGWWSPPVPFEIRQ